MMYFQLAWRYATRRLVNYIAILALALALAVQIVAMAVLDGMLVDLEKRLRNLGEQITLRVGGELPHRADFDKAAEALRRELPGVRGVTPLIKRFGLVEARNGADYVQVLGVDLADELAHSSLGDHLLSYKPNPAKPEWGGKGARPGMFMGEQLANRLGVKVGDEVELILPERAASGDIVVRGRPFEITSLYRSGVMEKDRFGVYVPIDQAGEFFLGDAGPTAGDLVETMVVWLDDPNQARALEERAGDIATSSLLAAGNSYPGIETNNWQDRWSEMAEGMKHENNLMELVLLLNDAASGFCVFAILVTLVSRRIRDVGLLRCIGASRRGVMTVFLLVGLLIGVSGGVLGVLAGTFLSGPLVAETVDGEPRLAAGGAVAAPVAAGHTAGERRPRIDVWYERITGYPLYPPRMFGTAGAAGLPTVVYPWKLALYFAAALIVSVVAALYPAAWAAWREPMSALREG